MIFLVNIVTSSIISFFLNFHPPDPKVMTEKAKEEKEEKGEKDEGEKGGEEKDDDAEKPEVQGCFAQVELTDGWYGVSAVLDKPLTLALRKGKIFAGQKLRIYGAKVPPLIHILFHIRL